MPIDPATVTLLKDLAPLVGPPTAAVIVGVFGLFTAKSITTKIEAMKLKAQADLERERMAFQRESEAQKQRMELYKTLYSERIVATKKTHQTVNSSIRHLTWSLPTAA